MEPTRGPLSTGQLDVIIAKVLRTTVQDFTQNVGQPGGCSTGVRDYNRCSQAATVMFNGCARLQSMFSSGNRHSSTLHHLSSCAGTSLDNSRICWKSSQQLASRRTKSTSSSATTSTEAPEALKQQCSSSASRPDTRRASLCCAATMSAATSIDCEFRHSEFRVYIFRFYEEISRSAGDKHFVPDLAQLPPEDIATMPAQKVVFNTPFDNKTTYYVRIINPGTKRIGFAFKTTKPKRIDMNPPNGVLRPKESVYIAISCDAFDPSSEDINGDRVTVQWTNTSDPAATTFKREWFQGDGIVRRKNLPIEYNV